MPPTLKGDNLTLHNLQIPNSVRPGGSFTVRVTVSNGALSIFFTDDDSCKVTAVGADGYWTKIRFTAFGKRVETQGVCIPTALVGTHDQTFDITFTAPSSPGTYKISAQMVLPKGQEQVSRALTETIAVTEEAPTPPPGEEDEKPKKTLLQTVIENPLGTAIVGVGGAFAIRKILSEE